jgi:NADH-quinone oxidoreductase subunit L
MFLLFQYVGTLDFPGLRTTEAMAAYRETFWGGERLAFWAGLFLFIGACGKSAQIPLYVWLPDAMAGPTPVSALIHAATMVTAGVYMVARVSFLYASSTTAMAVVAGVGALTALFAAIMAFAQTDFKRVLAYSTVSQLGFMFVGVGVGAYVAGVFHLLTHAFFKAGLFLAAGSVMHAMSGSGDIMKMGGLRKKLKLTHLSFVVYWLAICGIFIGGFFSKDEILTGAWAAEGQGWIGLYGEILWAILTLAALGTAFYMSRLYFLVFWGECRADDETKAHIHESPPSMTVPLLVLALGTVVVSFLGLPHFSFLGKMQNVLEHWLSPSVATADLSDTYMSIQESLGQASHLGEGTLGLFIAIALGVGLLGIGIAYTLYRNGVSPRVEGATESGLGAALYKLSYNKFYVDEFYHLIIVRPFRWAAHALYQVVDVFVIDFIFVNGVAYVTKGLGWVVRWVQNGHVHRYLAFLFLGAAALFFFTALERPWPFNSPAVDFSYRIQGNTMTFHADVGAGPSATARGAVVRWDFDGNGKPDLKPGASTDHPQESDYVSDLNPTVSTREVGYNVTLWYTDPVFGDTVKIVKAVDKTPKPTANPAAGPTANPTANPTGGAR